MADFAEKPTFGVGIHWAERADAYGAIDVVVSKVHLDGPADRSGKVKEGDVLIAVDGESVIAAGIAGAYTVDLVRSSASVTPRSSINESFQQPPQYAQGLATVGFSIDLIPPYKIADITEGSSVQARDFKIGDQLLSIDGRSVQGMNEAQIQAALAGPVGSIVSIKTVNMSIPVPVARDCALEIDFADLNQWKSATDVSQYQATEDSRRERSMVQPPPPPPDYEDDNSSQPRPDAKNNYSSFMMGSAATAEIILRLEVEYDSIIDIPQFAEEVRSDVASAANLDRSKVSVLNMKAGSTIVNLSVEGDESRSALSIAKDLKQQVSNPASALRTGKHTCSILDLTIPAENSRPGNSIPSKQALPSAARQNVQGFIDNQGIFRPKGPVTAGLEKPPMFSTNQIPQPAFKVPQQQFPMGLQQRAPFLPQQQPFANYNAVARPRSNGGSVGAQPTPGPFTMVNVGLNPQGMHPSIMMALKQQFANKEAASQNPFSNYYAAFRGGSVGGSNASLGGSSAGGSNAGDFGAGRLHSSLSALPPFQQTPWGVSTSAPVMTAVQQNAIPMQVVRPQFQTVQRPAFQTFAQPARMQVRMVPMPRIPQPNFQYQAPMMQTMRQQPIMLQMQQPQRMIIQQAPRMQAPMMQAPMMQAPMMQMQMPMQMQSNMMPMHAMGPQFWNL